eukprot:gene30289-35277_t
MKLHRLSVCDITFVSALTALQTLTIDICRQLVDISAMAALSNLLRLSIDDCPEIVDISAIGVLANLQQLKLTYCKGVRDLSALRTCYSLEELDLSSMHFMLARGLLALGSCSKLRRLEVSNCGGMDRVAAKGLLLEQNSELQVGYTDTDPREPYLQDLGQPLLEVIEGWMA